VHYRIGKAARGAIEEIGGTIPEDLPTAEKSILQLQTEQIKTIKGKRGKD
jgi:DNA-damage-inducible protein D